MTNKPSPLAMEQSRDSDEALFARGVRVRSVGLDSFRRDKQSLKAMATNAARGAEIRTSPTLPRRMIIYDRDHAIIATDATDPALGALHIASGPVVEMLIVLFERYWDEARPFPDGNDSSDVDADAGAPTAMELHVLQMLARGMKDESIARTTGQSVRTVRRVIAGLTEQAGAKGRFDLALEASRRGWLSD